MRFRLWPVLLLPLLAGCQWLENLSSSKAKNPVMGEPPPRIAGAQQRGQNAATRADGYDTNPQGDIRPASLSDGDADRQLVGAQVVAMVDGTPILASEILDRYAGQFKQVEGQASAEELRGIREHLIKRDLKLHVERRLLVNAMKRSLPKDAVGKLDEIIDKAFAGEIERLKQELKVETKYDLEQKLASEGTSLANLKDSFANQQLAGQYFQSKSKPKKIIGRPEMLQYYEEHLADYAIPAKARWQEIQINFVDHGGRDKALELMNRIVADLQRGGDFAALAKEHSDGVTAEKGGVWDWTQSGSLTDERIERALFDLPIGQVSRVFKGERSYRIIRVIDRQPARWKRFADVQAEIKETLEKQLKEQAAKKVIDDLMARAVITTVFDDDPDFRPEWRKR